MNSSYETSMRRLPVYLSNLVNTTGPVLLTVGAASFCTFKCFVLIFYSTDRYSTFEPHLRIVHCDSKNHAPCMRSTHSQAS